MEFMAAPTEFDTALGEALDLIDRELAEAEFELKNRPLTAARHFVTYFVRKIATDPDRREVEPGEFMDYADSEWFKLIYARTVAWYRGRYGAAMGGESGAAVEGVVLVLGTPFLMRVPLVTKRTGTPGETIWVCFPDQVEHDEDALAWIERGPNIATLPRGDGMKARRLAEEIAGTLRAIQMRIGVVETPTPSVGEFRDAIMPYLGRAAVQIAQARPETLKHAHWDMQMACETAFKMLAQQRSGSHPNSHDLYHLLDRLAGDKPFARQRLSMIPRWEKMAEWRYGRGDPVNIAETFSRYRATLRIVRALAEAAGRVLSLGGARIEVGPAPYLHRDPDMYLTAADIAERRPPALP